MERLEYWERFLKSKAIGCGSISKVFSSVVLLCVSSIIIIIIIIIIIKIIIIIIIIIIIKNNYLKIKWYVEIDLNDLKSKWSR